MHNCLLLYDWSTCFLVLSVLKTLSFCAGNNERGVHVMGLAVVGNIKDWQQGQTRILSDRDMLDCWRYERRVAVV